MTLRTPFYCTYCGAGYYEMMACEDVKCDREDVTEAKRRQNKFRQQAGSPLQPPDNRQAVDAAIKEK